MVLFFLYLPALFFSLAHTTQLLQMGQLLSGKYFPDSLTDGIKGSPPLVIQVSKLGFALMSR